MIPAAIKSFIDRNYLDDSRLPKSHTITSMRVLDDPRSPTIGICRTPIQVESPVPQQINVFNLVDPRSPTVDVSRTPIQVVEAVENMQLEDPRSPTLGLLRTPIQMNSEVTPVEQGSSTTPGLTVSTTVTNTVSSPLAHSKPSIRNRQNSVISAQEVAKKLQFSVNGLASENLPDTPTKNRKPLGLVCNNRLQGNSPLHLIRSKQAIAVERAMSKSVIAVSQFDLENTPPTRQEIVWDGRDNTFRL